MVVLLGGIGSSRLGGVDRSSKNIEVECTASNCKKTMGLDMIVKLAEYTYFVRCAFFGVRKN